MKRGLYNRFPSSVLVWVCEWGALPLSDEQIKRLDSFKTKTGRRPNRGSKRHGELVAYEASLTEETRRMALGVQAMEGEAA